MTERDDDLDIVLRSWMHQHAPDAPSDLVLRIHGEIETMSEQAPTRGWLSRFTAWPVGAWAATVAAVAVFAVAGALFLANFNRLSMVGDQPTPSPTTSSVDPTAIADDLIAAWNTGDGPQAVGLYSFPQPPTNPIIRFIVDSPNGDATDSYVTASNVADAVTAWHDKGTVLTRTGTVLTQGPFAAYPVSWTSSDGSFDGVEALRLSNDGFVTEQYLVGASSASATGAPVDAAQLVANLRDARNAADGSAASTLLAPTASGWWFSDGALVPYRGSTEIGRLSLISNIDQGAACCEASTTGIATQGPFILHTTSVTNSPNFPGAELDGVEILETTADGLVGRIWRIDTMIDLASSTPTIAPSAAPSTEPTAVSDALDAAWNAGNGQQAVSLYSIPQSPTEPIVRFMVDSSSGSPSDSHVTASDIADAVTAWHDRSSVLRRTGNVVTQGPYSAYPVTWTSSDGSFSGVEVLRISNDGLVAEQYLFGASSATVTGTAAGADALNGIHDGITAIDARLGATSSDSFALDANVYQFQDGAGGLITSGRDSIASVMQGALNTTPAHVGSVVTQGPFAVYAASNPITTGPVAASPTGAVEEGFTVLEVNGDGLIQHSWAIRARSSNTQAPADPGG